MSPTTIVPAAPGSNGDPQVVNQLLNPRQVGYNQFGTSALLNSVTGPQVTGLYLPGYTPGVTSFQSYMDLNNGAVTQEITPGSNTTFLGIEFFPVVVGDPRAVLVVQLQSHSGGAPSGTVLQEVHVPASVISAKAAAQINPTLGLTVNGGTLGQISVGIANGAIGTPMGIVGFDDGVLFGNGTMSLYNFPYDTGQYLNSGYYEFAGFGPNIQTVTYPLAENWLSAGPSLAYYNGTVYGIGGVKQWQGTITISSDVYSAPVSGDGTVGQWKILSTVLTGLPATGIANAGAVVVTGTDGNPYLVLIGGFTVVSNAYVANKAIYWARIAPSGELEAPVGFGGWGSVPCSNALLNDASGNVCIVAAAFGNTAVVGAANNSNSITPYGSYVLVNQLPTSAGLTQFTVRGSYGASAAAAVMGLPWFSQQGPLYAIGIADPTTSNNYSAYPSYIVKPYPAGSNAWASNPYPVIGGSSFLLRQGGSGGALIALGNGMYGSASLSGFSSYAQQLEAFRVPFNYPLVAGTTYNVVFSVLAGSGSVGPGSSVGLPLAFTNNTMYAGCQQYNGTSWVNVPAINTGYPQVSGFFFDTTGAALHSRYEGYVDTSATVVPAWETVYWNDWSQLPECIISVAGSQSEILFPTGDMMVSA